MKKYKIHTTTHCQKSGSSDTGLPLCFGVVFFMEEIWVKFNVHEGYEISNLGRFRNKKSGYHPTLFKTNSGYVLLRGHNFGKTLHRQVALHFIENPLNLPQVNHKDGNKDNNRVDNLEWCTQNHNVKSAWDMGLMENSREKARERMKLIGLKHSYVNSFRLKNNMRDSLGHITKQKKETPESLGIVLPEPGQQIELL